MTEFIEDHLGDELTVARLADEACLSPFHFARAFRSATGTAPHRYLTERRLERARTLLAEDALSIAEIAARCGFSSQSYFTRRPAPFPPGMNRAPNGTSIPSDFRRL